MAETLTGGCLCGAVRYTVTGDLAFSGKCYCDDCRKTSATGHGSVFAAPEQAVQITGKVTEYSKAGGSGHPVKRRFCPVCGSKIAVEAVALPGLVLVTASSLDDPEKFVSQMSIYTSRAPSWDQPPAGSPSFPEMPPTG